MTDRLDLLDESVDALADLMEGIEPAMHPRPTPCAEFTVGDLVDHLVGWIHVFEAATNDTEAARDPSVHLVREGQGGAFRRAGHGAVDGLRRLGTDRTVAITSSPIPASMVVDMMTMEYPGHGWDLAVATGLPYPFDDRVVAAAHEAAERMIQPPYRGDEAGQFRPVVPTPGDAPPVDRFVAFLGRDPAWRPDETYS
ncbi:MAG: TIGR03086 family metal-binding protein [Actinomycetota bacterium]